MVVTTPGARALRRRAGPHESARLIEDHCYTVLDARTRRGYRYLRLYTPLVDFTSAPVTTPTPIDNARRRIDVTLEDYRRIFDGLVVNGAAKRSR